MRILTILFLMSLSSFTLAGVADAELNINLTLEEIYNLNSNQISPESTHIYGQADYLLGAAWGLAKKRGEIEIKQTQVDEIERIFEITDINEVTITLLELNESVAVPAIISRDEEGNLISMEIEAHDILDSAIPIKNNKLRSLLGNHLSRKILNKIPLSPDLEFGRIECSINEDSLLICLQNIKIEIGI